MVYELCSSEQETKQAIKRKLLLFVEERCGLPIEEENNDTLNSLLRPQRAYIQNNSSILNLDNQQASHRFTLCLFNDLCLFNESMW
jgi:hypothetical protein